MNDFKEPDSLQRIHQRLKKLWIYRLITGLFILFLLVYLVFAILAPLKTIKILQTEFKSDPKENWELAGINSTMDSILRSTAMINSKLLLTDKDSICFSINLKDSTINLELQGVTIHRTKISRFSTSRIFSKTGNACLYKYISTPFTAQQYKSTIVKIPIVIKQAPKDTIEANKINDIPQLPPEEYVRYTFWFDKPLILIVEQEEKPSGTDKFKSFTTKTGDKFKFFNNIASGIFSFEVPEYYPWIKIKIPQDEAKTIFRALPENAAMALEL